MMNFLAFDLFKPSTWLSGSASGVMGAILGGIRTFFFEIATVIYQLIVNVYNLFQKLCSARILSNSILGEMAKRIGLLLGLVMFFYVIFSLIQILMDPEKISDKEKGAVSIIKKAVIVIVLLGVSNGAFGLLYKIQNQIIDSNVISNIILPYKIEGDAKENFGNLLSMQLMMAFYQVDTIDEQTISDASGKEKLDACSNLTNAFYEQIYKDNKYNKGFLCLNESIKITQNSPTTVTNGNTDEIYFINFNGIIAVLVGGFTVYLLLMYCFKIGVRIVQLAFLEIISPMAFISYLEPKKDTMLTKWWKIYFSTYIDVFIRIAIINFVVFLICTIFAPTGSGDGNFTFWQSLGNPQGVEKGFFSVVIILALLTFAQKAPDLIKELIPASASKLGFGMAMKDIVGLEKAWKWTSKTATGVLGGALGGAAIGLLGGGLGGFAGGLLKGGLSGLKGQGFAKTAASAWKSQQATNKRVQEWRNAGGTSIFGRWGAAFNQWRGIETEGDIFDREKTELEENNALYSQVSSGFKTIKERAKSKIADHDFDGNSHVIASNNAKNMADMLRGQAGNLKVEDFCTTIDKNDYYDSHGVFYANEYNEACMLDRIAAEQKFNDKQRELSAEITRYDAIAAEQLDKAVEDYYNEKKDTDGVLLNETAKVENILGTKIKKFEEFKVNDALANNIKTANDIALANNKKQGKAARANAQYSGRK